MKDRGFFHSIFHSLMQAIMKFVVAFLVGTGIGACVCLYYGAPIGFALIGGFVVLGVALALIWDSSLF